MSLLIQIKKYVCKQYWRNDLKPPPHHQQRNVPEKGVNMDIASNTNVEINN